MAENVLLITVDSLRAYPFLSAETKRLLTSPARVTRDGGMSFSRAFATGPTTKMSFPAILTGTYGLDFEQFPRMHPDRPALAESLRDCGIYTAGFNSNPYLSREFNYQTGFDTYRDYQTVMSRKGARLFPEGIEKPGKRIEWLDQWIPVTATLKWVYELVSGQSRPYTEATRIVDDTIETLATTTGRFFYWVHFMDAHHPCFPPGLYRRRHDVAESVESSDVDALYSRFVSDPDSLTTADVDLLERLYRAAIEYVDEEINRLLDALAERELLDSTAVVLTSDHGELFGEHGEYSKLPRFYEELVQVPLFVSETIPDVAPDELFSLLDLPYLVHHLLDCDPGQAYSGRSPIGTDPRRTVAFEDYRNGEILVGVRSDRWLYEIDQIRGEHRLVDLQQDTVVSPESVTDETATLVKQRAVDHFENVGSHDDTIDVSEDVSDRLAELGYLE